MVEIDSGKQPIIYRDESAPIQEIRTEGLSAGRKRTLRAKAMIEAGRHPLTKDPLVGDGRTCGDCLYHFVNHLGKRYHKCEWNVTGGPATDIRVSWPACVRIDTPRAVEAGENPQ